MERQILREEIGTFFTKMYEANEGKDMEVSINMSEGIIQVYDKFRVKFTDIKIVDELPTLDTIIQSLN